MRLLLAILLLLFVAPASAQQGQGMSKAVVVSACGSGAAPSGALNQLTMDTTGRLCQSGTFGLVSTWSPADAAANGATLTNGNLTAEATSTGYTSIRGTQSKSSGKLYIEFKQASPASGFEWFGVASSSANPLDQLGNSNYSIGIRPATGSVGFDSAASSYNYAPNMDYTTAIAGDVWAFAIDFGTGNLWMAYNNVWVGSGDPSAGLNPLLTVLLATTGPIFPAIAFAITQGVWTLQGTPATQKYAPPSGFKAWDAP